MKRILIVDDEVSIRELLHSLLSSEGYAILEAGDGKEALDLLKQDKVDLIITDRTMPGMGGLELLRALKDAGKTIPTLMISAYGEEQMWGDAVSSGAQDYILKPFKADDILKAVKKIFTNK